MKLAHNSIKCRILRVLTTKRKEDAIYDHERRDVFGLLELSIATAHDETDNALSGNKHAERQAWAHPVTGPRAQDSSREIEKVDKTRPAEGLPKLCLWLNYADPCRRVNAERICQEIVDEPNKAYNEKSRTVEFQGQPVRRLPAEVLASV